MEKFVVQSMKVVKSKRYVHIYRLVDEILKAGDISEELLRKIVRVLKRKWMNDYRNNKQRGEKNFGKN